MRRTLLCLIFVAAPFCHFPCICSARSDAEILRYLQTIPNSNTRGDGKDVCRSQDCKNAVERILNYMDPKINPCDDFYQFTCGNLLKSELPKGKSSVSSMIEVQEMVNTQLRELLEEPIEPKEHDAYKATKKFYALCLDDKKRPRDATEASNRLRWAGWPVLGGWRKDQWTIHDHEIRLKDLTLGGGGLFHIGLSPDAQIPGRVQLTLDQPKLNRKFTQDMGMQVGFIDTLELPHTRTYQDYMVDLAVMFGADRRIAKTQLRDSLLFELDLEKIVDTPSVRHRPYELMTVAQLQSRAGWVDWPALLAAAVVPKSIGEDELVKVYQPDYLDRLRRLIEQYPSKVVANFMGWRAAERLSLMLTPEMVSRRMQFEEEVGLDVRQPWEQCVELISSSGLGLAISSMYVKKHNPSEYTKLVAKEMTSKLREQMYSLIKAQEWMDDNTKIRALLKLCKMNEYIGYPKELVDSNKIDEYYQGLNLDIIQKDFLAAEIVIEKWMIDVGIRRLFDHHWAAHGSVASLVEAFYNPEANLLQLTAAILHPPFFNPRLPNYMYYSAIGAIAGHEITHGFDNNGVNFDEDGNFMNWWDDSTKMNFDEKSECLRNQYIKYIDNCNTTVAGGPIPYLAGNRSLGEVIADNGGLKLAYLAYKKLSDQLDKPEPLLPNLEQFTRDQMFFISLGNLYCALNDRNKLRSLSLRDVHPPMEFRINGMFQNFPKFSEAFECKPGTNMNPKNKCSVW